MADQPTELSRPKFLNHLIKGAFFGWAAYQLGLQLRDPGLTPIPAVLWGSATWLCLAALLRNLHALIVWPCLQASADGLRLRYWKPSRFLTWKMFLPCNIVVDATIPWSDYFGCRTSVVSGGDPWDAQQRLLVESRRDLHEIGWDVFAHSVTRLMEAISDYREVQFRSPYKTVLAVADFQRLRFAQPLRVEQPPAKGDWLGFGCFIFVLPLLLVMGAAGGVLVTMFGSLALSFVCRTLGLEDLSQFINQGMNHIETPFGKGPLLVVLGIIGGIVVTAGSFLWMMWKDANVRILEFRADGLAFGSKPHSLTVVPWDDVLYAGVMTETTYRAEGAGLSSDHLEVRLRGRSALVLNGNYPRSVSDLKELIDPPVEKLAIARQQLDTGASLEQAVRTAGLPWCAPA